MAFLVLGANSVSGYTVKNSLRFNSGSSDYLNRTPASASNQKTMTFSFWAKRSTLSSATDVISQGAGSACHINFDGSNQIEMNLRNSVDGASNVFLITSQLFRDVSAWYHIVLALDTTQATNTNRVKLYVNGTQVTAFSTTTYPSQNGNLFFNEASAINIGRSVSTGSHYNGYMSDVFFIDGQALTPSSFGETDTLSGIWIPKSYSGSYGTNGFFLKFLNSASLGTDSSGNGNTFTVNNLTSIDQTTDTPTNNFATLNPLVNTNGVTYTEGNLKVNFANNASWARGVACSIVLDTGKWYWEVKQTAVGYNITGVTREDNLTFYSGQSATYLYTRNMNALQDDGSLYTNGTYSAGSYTWTTGDILMFALDMTNKKMYVGKNGTWFNSGNPSAGTGQIFSSSDFTSGYGYVPVALGYDLGTDPIMDFNFGNPPYSANSYTDGAGYGNFSYAVPSGYYSLNTKNLANFG